MYKKILLSFVASSVIVGCGTSSINNTQKEDISFDVPEFSEYIKNLNIKSDSEIKEKVENYISSLGEDISNLKIDTNGIDDYLIITFDRKKSDGTTETITKKINKTWNSIPNIKLLGEETVYLNIGDIYKEQGVVLVDREDGELNKYKILDNNVDTSHNGTYYINYMVEDSDRNKNTAKRKIVVGNGIADISDINNKDCLTILKSGGSTGDGIYTIDPDGDGGNDPFDVYCDMTTDGGGWTAFYKNNGGPTANGLGFQTLHELSSGNEGIAVPLSSGGNKEAEKNYNIYNRVVNMKNVKFLKTINSYKLSDLTTPWIKEFGVLDFGDKTTFNDLFVEDTYLKNQISLNINNEFYGKSNRLKKFHNISIGFANQYNNDDFGEPSYNLMKGWNARHFIGYTNSSGQDAVRCQFTCWTGHEDYLTEVVWFYKEKTDLLPKNKYGLIENFDIDMSNGFTISVNGKLEKINGTNDNIWERIFDIGNGNPSDNIILGRYSNTNKLFFHIYNGSSYKLQSETTNDVIDGKYHNYTVVADPINNNYKLFIDGVETELNIKTLNTTINIKNIERKKSYIGHSNWSFDTKKHDEILNFKLWNKPLTDENINSIFNNPFFTDDSLKIDYDFNKFKNKFKNNVSDNYNLILKNIN